MKKKKKRSVFRKRKFPSNGIFVRSFHIIDCNHQKQKVVAFAANDNDGLPREVA